MKSETDAKSEDVKKCYKISLRILKIQNTFRVHAAIKGRLLLLNEIKLKFVVEIVKMSQIARNLHRFHVKNSSSPFTPCM